ncbi:hypothetical protein HPP92_028945 [Vanilla planifolia]|uniref:Uncharacterized protein n=1 Tax=Vanilla planifolia TaxID=51239 RepID=A0A835P424_VANPL|nr:hypothetical protein HPP92_028935 [Vanilla planifolia]KAG0446242.1 hypothetical protein HPP92_028945 [Vanilla planifolia]
MTANKPKWVKIAEMVVSAGCGELSNDRSARRKLSLWRAGDSAWVYAAVGGLVANRLSRHEADLVSMGSSELKDERGDQRRYRIMREEVNDERLGVMASKDA